VCSSDLTEFQAPRDIKGPIPVGSEIDYTPAAKPHIPLEEMTRLVGFGSSGFPSNQFIEMLGNRDLAVSLVNELAGDEMLISSREMLNKGATPGFYATDRQADWLAYLAAGFETLLLLTIAIAVFVRRRFFA
jgi:hypothetical protein